MKHEYKVKVILREHDVTEPWSRETKVYMDVSAKYASEAMKEGLARAKVNFDLASWDWLSRETDGPVARLRATVGDVEAGATIEAEVIDVTLLDATVES